MNSVRNDVFVVDALRTPFASLGGKLSSVSAPELGAQVVAAMLQRIGLPFDKVDEVIMGQVLQGGAGQSPARQVLRQVGLPDSIPATTVNKICGSGLKAILMAADSISLGRSGIVVAGGMESMSSAPYALPGSRFGRRLGHGECLDLLIHDCLWDPYGDRHMGEIVDEWTAAHSVSREDQDSYAIRSYSLAKSAIREGTLGDELIDVVIPSQGEDIAVSEDEEPFRVDIEGIRNLAPAFGSGGTITAGNASSIGDGAAAAVLASGRAVEENRLTPIARLIAGSTCCVHPDKFAEAPVGAIKRCCDVAGLRPEDIGLFEINEAFSSVPLVAIRQLGLDPDRVNVNGGAVAMGHPVGASGGRLVATLVREMKQRNEPYGLAALCIGGGEALAVLIELI